MGNRNHSFAYPMYGGMGGMGGMYGGMQGGMNGIYGGMGQNSYSYGRYMNNSTPYQNYVSPYSQNYQQQYNYPSYGYGNQYRTAGYTSPLIQANGFQNHNYMAEPSFNNPLSPNPILPNAGFPNFGTPTISSNQPLSGQVYTGAFPLSTDLNSLSSNPCNFSRDLRIRSKYFKSRLFLTT